MKLSLAIQTPEVPLLVPVALLTGTWEEKLAKAARLGVQGVDLMTVDPDALDAAALRANLQRHGLHAAAIGSGAVTFATGMALLHADPAQATEARRRLDGMIRLAAALGAPLVTIGSFRGWLAQGGASARARLATILREAATEAAAQGVRLALEPLNRYETDLVHTVAEGLDFIQEIGHPAVGLLLDTYHVNIEESSWTEPFRQAMAAGLLWHVHVGDNNRLPPGRGLIDFGAILETLRAIGYDGYLAAELLGRPDPDAAAAETVAYLGPLLNGRG